MLFGLKLVIDDNVESQSAKVIGITSPRAGDGKTTLAFNLASSIAAGLTSLQAEVAHIMAVVRTRLADMDVTYNVDPATISRLQRGCHDRASRPHDRRQLSPPAKDMSDADIIIFVSRHVR